MTLLSRSHLLLLALSLAGALLCWNAGHKGLFLLDQSMIFDSAWRILQGQMPYRDFGMPFGPISSLLQAASFCLLGLHWDAMVFPATLLHALSVPLVWATQRRLFPEQPGLAAWSAALFAALSFYSPIGTLWFETTGIFFYLLALYLLTGNRPVADFAAGALLLVVFLSKQNVALFYGPCLLAWILLRPAPSGTRLPALLRFASGGLALLLTLLLAAYTTGTLPAAWHYLIEIPRQIAAARTSAAGLPMGYPVLLNYVLAALFLALLPCLALQGLRHQWRPAVFHLIEIVAWALTALSTANELVIYAFGAGRLLSNTYALLSSATHREAPRPLWLRALTPTYILLTALPFSTFVLYNVQTRYAMQFYQPARFDRLLQSPGLSTLRWGNPTPLTDLATGQPHPFPPEDLEGVLAFLRAQRRPFFVWGDSTLLYGLTQQPSPSPLLYFGANHSYRRGHNQDLDQRLLAQLQQAQVQYIVQETALYLNKDVNDLRDFPLTLAWIQTHFAPAQSFGLYQILARSR